MGKLSARRIETIKKPGRYPDGTNLYLQVGPNGMKSWALLFMLRGRARQMGLGPMDLNPDPTKRVGLNLADARDEAYKARRLLLQGVDPIEHRNASRVPESARQRSTHSSVSQRVMSEATRPIRR